jgi:DNA-binding PucR family transcriptional regulator
MQCPPGLYRFADHALLYQHTRSGPGRRTLPSTLDPLDDNPELLDTLARHLHHNGNRRTTAHDLHLHENSVNNRLRRIRELTGINPLHPSGMWQLRSAMLARQAELDLIAEDPTAR